MDNTNNSGDTSGWKCLTFNPCLKGENIIGNFNSEGLEAVDKIKKLSTELVDLINSFAGKELYKEQAIINIAQGQMWAVKSLF